MGGKVIEAVRRLPGGFPQAARFPLSHPHPHRESSPAQGPEHEAAAQGAASGEFAGGAAADQGNGSQGRLEIACHRLDRVRGREKGHHQGRCLNSDEAFRKEGGDGFGDRPGGIGVAGTAAAHPAGAGTAGFRLDRQRWHERGAWGGIGHGGHGGRSTPSYEGMMGGWEHAGRNRRRSAPETGGHHPISAEPPPQLAAGRVLVQATAGPHAHGDVAPG